MRIISDLDKLARDLLCSVSLYRVSHKFPYLGKINIFYENNFYLYKNALPDYHCFENKRHVPVPRDSHICNILSFMVFIKKMFVFPMYGNNGIARGGAGYKL